MPAVFLKMTVKELFFSARSWNSQNDALTIILVISSKVAYINDMEYHIEKKITSNGRYIDAGRCRNIFLMTVKCNFWSDKEVWSSGHYFNSLNGMLQKCGFMKAILNITSGKNLILLMYLGIIKRCEKFQFSWSNRSGEKIVW